METRPKDDPGAYYANETGLCRLVGRSAFGKAEKFQDWVYEEVLMSICKTGSYAVSCQVTQTAKDTLDVAEWQGKRAVAKQLTKAKSSKIHQVIGRKAKGFTYGPVNAALTRSVADKNPEILRAEYKLKITPRDFMPPPAAAMLGLLGYCEDC